LAEACREEAAVIRRKLRLKRRAGAREVAIPMAPRSSSFEPVASGKAQPREAPLEVVVVQLQQSQLATLAV
jgi:hypothetical protein